MTPVLQKKKQVEEIIRCGKDPVYFLNKYVKIQHPTKGTIPFKTFPFQDDCVKDFIDHRFNIVLKSRQLGLSTLVAGYAVWQALFYKDKNILVIATKLSVAMNFIKKVKTSIKALPPWLVMSQIVGDNKQAIEFGNGSSIKAIPTSEDAGRSEALSLLIVDEAAFVRDFDNLWMGLYPTLSTGGRAIILSTPNGVGGQYYDLYVKAESKENEFHPIKLPWDVHPERDEAWFERESKNMTPQQIAQELLCDFSASGDTFLTIDDIDYLRTMIRNPIEKWGPEMGVWVWKYPMPGHSYIVSADVARGDGADYSTFHVIDTSESEVVAEFKGKSPPDQFAIVLNEAALRYNKAVLCPESNTYGYALLMKLAELRYPNLYFEKQSDKYAVLYGNGSISKAGFSTQGPSRAKILTKLEEIVRNKNLRIYSSRLYDEMKTFIWKNNKAQAMKDKNDDLVMSLAIGVWLYEVTPHNKQAVDINAAILKAMSVNRGSTGEALDPLLTYAAKTGKPVVWTGELGIPGPDSGTKQAVGPVDFGWLFK